MPRLTLDEALDAVTVHDSSDVNASLEATGEDFAPYPDDHFLVSDDRTGGIHAQFTTEADACAWRMYLVGQLLSQGPVTNQSYVQDDPTVKCNQCDWRGHEEALVICQDDDGIGKGCPDCKTDAALMDIDPNGIIPAKEYEEAKALEEGWLVASTTRDGLPITQIERYDEATPFLSDVDALFFVMERAKARSSRHIHALQLCGGYDALLTSIGVIEEAPS